MPPIFEYDLSKKEEEAGILPSHGIAVDLPNSEDNPRPTNIRHVSVMESH